jgi:hypothetical protein
MTPEQISEESRGLLSCVLNEAYLRYEQGNLRQAFISRHARTILCMSNDVFLLEANQMCCSSAIIVRSMLEGLFNLVAAVKKPHFVPEKLVWEIEDEVDRVRKWIKAEEETAKELENLAQSLRQQNQIPPKLNWNTYQCAEAAELGNLYRREYFLFSKRTHATTSGLISMESGISRGHVLKTVVYILIATAANLVQAVPTDTPQKHVDRASELIAILTDMVSRGAFEDLNPSDDSLPA